MREVKRRGCVIENNSHLRCSEKSKHIGMTSMDRVRLDQFECGRVATVYAVEAGAGQPAERASQLTDIGFIPGERVMVLAQAWPSGDPLVVRIGHSRFALRCAEAACVTVEPQP